MAPKNKDMSPTPSTTGSTQQTSSRDTSFKAKIQKLDVFIKQPQQLKK